MPCDTVLSEISSPPAPPLDEDTNRLFSILLVLVLVLELIFVDAVFCEAPELTNDDVLLLADFDADLLLVEFAERDALGITPLKLV